MTLRSSWSAPDGSAQDLEAGRQFLEGHVLSRGLKAPDVAVGVNELGDTVAPMCILDRLRTSTRERRASPERPGNCLVNVVHVQRKKRCRRTGTLGRARPVRTRCLCEVRVLDRNGEVGVIADPQLDPMHGSAVRSLMTPDFACPEHRGVKFGGSGCVSHEQRDAELPRLKSALNRHFGLVRPNQSVPLEP